MWTTRHFIPTASRGLRPRLTPSRSTPALFSSQLRRFGALASLDNQEEAGELTPQQRANLTPEGVVAELDKHIIGQQEAKKAVAVALRARWRRQQLNSRLQTEIKPVNILMMGPTGTGKTEVARRLAKIADAPFIKVEATKYTEVGIYGANTDSMIKDLVEAAISLERAKRKRAVRAEAVMHAQDTVLDALRQSGSSTVMGLGDADLRQGLVEGLFDSEKLELQLPDIPQPKKPSGLGSMFNMDGGGPPGIDPSALNKTMETLNEMMSNAPGGMFGGRSGDFKKNRSGFGDYASAQQKDKPKKRKQSTTVAEALRRFFYAKEAELVDDKGVEEAGLRSAQESGIVFLDEIDKLALSGEAASGGNLGLKGEGVQKELLALVEGTTVSTQHGPINTDHVMFIGSGAFHKSKPSDLMPELQGRLPVRVQLQALTQEDLGKILTDTECSLLEQQRCLMETEGVSMTFTEDGIEAMAKLAADLNVSLENIGARRLNTIVAQVMADVSYSAPSRKDKGGAAVEEVVDAEYVRSKMKPLVKDTNLSKYVL